MPKKASYTWTFHGKPLQEYTLQNQNATDSNPLDPDPPDPDLPDRDERGWPCFERAVATLLKDAWMVFVPLFANGKPIG